MRGNQINVTFKQDKEEYSLYLWLKMKRNQGIFIKEILLKYKELEQKGYSFTDIFSLNRVTSIESFTTNQVQSEEQLPDLPDIQVSDTTRITPAVSNVQDDIDFGEWGAE